MSSLTGEELAGGEEFPSCCWRAAIFLLDCRTLLEEFLAEGFAVDSEDFGGAGFVLADAGEDGCYVFGFNLGEGLGEVGGLEGGEAHEWRKVGRVDNA